MIKWIKSNFWAVIGGLITLAVVVLLRDMDRAEELKAFFRKKRVEDDVGELRQRLAESDVKRAANDEYLVALAEKLKQEKKKVKDASDAEIEGFYDDLFNGD